MKRLRRKNSNGDARRVTNRRRKLTVQPLESRQLLAGDLPLGATPVDTGEFLLGTVAVTPVFFESDGSIDPQSQNWTEQEIQDTLVKIRESVDWWTDLLQTKNTVHSLDFVIDDTYAIDPVETGYEPIDRSSFTFERYVGSWLTGLGYGDAPSIERAVHLFNDSQRAALNTDWAFTMFVVDSSDDPDGFFAAGGFNGAFAYAGGLFMIVPSERPVSTYTHEMGHIFWARDEYPGAGSWTDTRGYYNAQNINASDNPTPGFVQQDSIMRGGIVAQRAFDNLDSPESTLALVGWRDSDGDGVFDVLDVPLKFDVTGSFDAESSIYSLEGSAAVSTLDNLNSSGPQSDITLARVREIQYRLDDGDWISALAPDATSVDIDLDLSLTDSFDVIHWRAIDTDTGVTSETVQGTRETPLLSRSGNGYVFADLDQNQNRSLDEPLLVGTQVILRHDDGRQIFNESLIAGGLSDGEITTENRLTFGTLGSNTDGKVGVFSSGTLSSAGSVIHGFDTGSGSWKDAWGADRQLTITPANRVGRFALQFTALDTGSYGFESGSYARVEAYDASGNRIARVTSELVLAGDQGTLVVQDPDGRIANVKIYGHAETEILINGVEFGQSYDTMLGADGSFSTFGLTAGSYTAEIVLPNVIYDLPVQTVEFNVFDGFVSPIVVAAERIDSIRHNASTAEDVNQDGEITLRDALAVINDLGRSGNRTLTADETEGLKVDVNNDGTVSTLDALIVINRLQQISGEGEFTGSEFTDSGSNSSFSRRASDGAPGLPSDRLSASVDRFFSRFNSPEVSEWYNGSQGHSRKMLNYAGSHTSGQSQRTGSSDRNSGVEDSQPRRDESDESRDESAAKKLRDVIGPRLGFADPHSPDEVF